MNSIRTKIKAITVCVIIIAMLIAAGLGVAAALYHGQPGRA